ncbi:MAG TPA: hypothetical protein DEF47_09585 [Herpetosiphon sp.]|uniref:Uncharacterized protein n=1 Tax=Herpetosiphon aurantiacus (strain ATCC 23779 / DSM 785 / 114-95) TaxID=316274 RepID=A9B8C3_HERA2|nr:hypothetical protein [Herpetosiphon sp.]ABX06476.1 hypothetical protein Haur_3840 [Herpetosiphon aurantiacus DSM 785]HBW50144.1 hypothetical protein [Herpetosiphon sp.]
MPKRPPLPEAVRDLALYQFSSSNAERTTRGRHIITAATDLEYRWGFDPESTAENPIYLVKVQIQHWDIIQPEIYMVSLVDQAFEISEIKLGDRKVAWSHWRVVPSRLS